MRGRRSKHHRIQLGQVKALVGELRSHEHPTRARPHRLEGSRARRRPDGPHERNPAELRGRRLRVVDPCRQDEDAPPVFYELPDRPTHHLLAVVIGEDIPQRVRGVVLLDYLVTGRHEPDVRRHRAPRLIKRALVNAVAGRPEGKVHPVV